LEAYCATCHRGMAILILKRKSYLKYNFVLIFF
jgi:hypothetical protein